MRHSVVEEDLRRILAQPLPWEVFAGSTVLITGGGGFVSAYMAEALLAYNEQSRRPPARVVALVRDRQRAERRFAHYAGRRDLEFLVQDVCDPLPADLRAEYVIHAAGQASPKYYGRDPVGTVAPNVWGTRQVLEAAAAAGSRSVLFFSSSEVYGQPDLIPTPEDAFGPIDPMHVRSCYAESKRLGENLCAAYVATRGVPAKVARPFHTYGPGMRLDDGRVFADFVADVVAGRDIVLRSAGTARRAFCYLADAVVGFFTVLLRGEVGRAYNVGDPRGELAVRDLAELLVGLFPGRGLRIVCDDSPRGNEYLASPVSRSCPDISRLQALGWQPTTGLAEGFRRTVESYA